jgi:hypothetical protein
MVLAAVIVIIVFGVVLGVLAVAEPIMRKIYVRRISALSVAENTDERILTYPLA